MMTRLLLILSLSSILARSLASSQNSTVLTEPCTAVEAFLDETVSLLCKTPSDMFYNVPVPPSWIALMQTSGELVSGVTKLELPINTTINADTLSLELPDEQTPILVNEMDKERKKDRNLAVVSGTKTALAVRIVATNSEVSVSEDTLRSSVFGGNGDNVNLRTQYAACSYGKLEFTEADDRNGIDSDTSIVNGAVTLKVNLPTEAGKFAMVNAVTEELTKQFGVSVAELADHVLYCLPKDTMTGVGYAMMNSWLSVYNDDMCTSVSVQMHEVGHNLGLGHSSLGSNKYGDMSGLMGYSYKTSEVPQMCFNAAKNFQLGWYGDKAKSLSADSGYQYSGKLGGIVDYATSDNDVIVEVQQHTLHVNYYIGFNAAKGFNSQVKAGINQVLVFEKAWNDGMNSYRVAELDAGESHYIPDFDGVKGETLKILVNSIENSVAEVSIVLLKPNAPPTPPPTQDQGARIPDGTGTGGPGDDCLGNYEECSSDDDCCSGFECRKISTEAGLSWACRTEITQSKDDYKIDRTPKPWTRRRLRGDTASRGATNILEDSQ